MHRPISDQSGGGKGGKGSKGGFRQGRSFEAPIGGFPKQVANTQASNTQAANTGGSKSEAGEGAPKQRKFKERKKGFTLLELLIVIGIIVILASLVLAVSSSVARASEERATRNTLQVLDLATEEFERTVDRRATYRSAIVTGGIAADPISVPGSSPAIPYKYDIDSAAGAPPAGSGVPVWTSLPQPYSSVTAGLPAYSSLPFRRTALLIAAMAETPSVAPILQKLPEAIFRGIKQSATSPIPTAVRHAVDAWDTPIIAVFPGREATAAEVLANNPNIVDKDGTVKCDSEWGSAASGGMQLSCKDRRILWVSAGNDSRFHDVPVGTTYKPSSDNLYSYEP